MMHIHTFSEISVFNSRVMWLLAVEDLVCLFTVKASNIT
jgi:hypothetical protein